MRVKNAFLILQNARNGFLKVNTPTITLKRKSTID